MLSKNREKWLKEGRGQGELSDYKPWIKISDIFSSGRSHRVFGHKTRRIHHLMSDLELAIFIFFEWNQKAIDIREQFPLKFDETIDIAGSIQVKHPAIRGNIHIMTSDFYVVSSDIEFSQLVLQAKYSDELKKPRVIEKLEIERRYWNSKGVPWQIVTLKKTYPTLFKITLNGFIQKLVKIGLLMLKIIWPEFVRVGPPYKIPSNFNFICSIIICMILDLNNCFHYI